MVCKMCRWFGMYWRTLVVVFAPIVCLPLIIYYPGKETRCAFVMIIMGTYWVTEALPIAATSLIPVFAFPLLGVINTEEICPMYMKETVMMYIGGLTVAIAVEFSNLHRRIALMVILNVGQSPVRLMAGFMITTMFLSMWISNTAATAMMVPIVDAILHELYELYDAEDSLATTSKRKTIQKSDSIVYLNSGRREVCSSKENTSTSFCPGAKTDFSELSHPYLLNVSAKETPPMKHSQNFVIMADASQMIMPTGNKTLRSSSPVDDVNIKKKFSSSSEDMNDSSISGSAPSGEHFSAREVQRDGTLNKSCRALRDMCFLATAYGANLGGTGTLTGTGTNLIMKGILKTSFPESNELNFVSWMMFCVPAMLLCGILAFIWLQVLFVGCGSRSKLPKTTAEKEKQIRHLIQRKYDDLGPIRFQEKAVLFWFIVLVLLWLLRAPGFIEGWGSYFVHWFGPMGSIGDATPAVLIGFILFVFPAKPNFMCFRDPSANSYPGASPACLTWKVVQEKLPWGIVLLIGGGLAMAKATQESGLSELVGSKLQYLHFLSPVLVVFVVSVGIALATEITSNTATAAVLLPILKDMSLALCISPLYLMLPATLCCSYAFMLPVATPPNSIVYGAANMETKEMIKAGFMLNISCVLVVTLLINTLGTTVFELGTMPSWANATHC